MEIKKRICFPVVPMFQVSSLAAGSPGLQPALAKKESWALWSLTGLTWLHPPTLPYLASIRSAATLPETQTPNDLPWFYHPELSHHCDVPSSTLVPLQPILHLLARLSQRDCQSDLITPFLKALLRLFITLRVQTKHPSWFPGPSPQAPADLLGLLSQLSAAIPNHTQDILKMLCAALCFNHFFWP